MKSSLITLAATLKLPSLNKADITSLKSLQRDWERHSERMNHLRPERALADQKTAFTAFLADPTEENEQRLAVLADERLTAKRYGLLHEAHAELRHLTNQKAAGIVRPVLESIQQALQGELEVREAAAQAEGISKHIDERCVQLREALAQVAHGLKLLDEATNITPVEDRSPLDLAAMLQPGEVDTPVA
jgi:hypothetical protein